LNSIFSPQRAERLHQVANAIFHSQRGTGQHVPGGVRTRWGQLGLAAFLSSTGEPLGVLGGASVMVGPALITRALTNRNVARWLTVGLNARPGSDSARFAFTRLAAAVADVEAQAQKETLGQD
jgi:hypothetical protein